METEVSARRKIRRKVRTEIRRWCHRQKMVETVYLLLRERHLIWRMYRHIPVSRMWQSMEMCRILPMRT